MHQSWRQSNYFAITHTGERRNEMILAKYDICTILEGSTHSELTAKLKLNLWKKV